MLKRRIKVLFWKTFSPSWELFGRWQSLKVRLSDFFVDVLFWKISYSCFSSCHFAFAENQEEPFDFFVLIYGYPHRCFLKRRIVKLKIICVWSQERGMSQPCDSDCARFYLHLPAISHRGCRTLQLQHHSSTIAARSKLRRQKHPPLVHLRQSRASWYAMVAWRRLASGTQTWHPSQSGPVVTEFTSSVSFRLYRFVAYLELHVAEWIFVHFWFWYNGIFVPIHIQTYNEYMYVHINFILMHI